MPLRIHGLLLASLLVACSDAHYTDGGRRTDLGSAGDDEIDLAAGGESEAAGRSGAAGARGPAGTSGAIEVGGTESGGSAGVRSDR